MQLLYEIDMRGEQDVESIERELADDAFDSAEVCARAFELAQAAWHDRQAADVAMTQLAPDWPTHRQPPLDRAILRLAYHEMTSGRTPAKVAVNEAVELAKQFCSEQSPAFINGVLDKIARQFITATQSRLSSPGTDA